MKYMLVIIYVCASLGAIAQDSKAEQQKEKACVERISNDMIQASKEIVYGGQNRATISKDGVRLVEAIAKRSLPFTLAEFGEIQEYIREAGLDHDYKVELIFALLLWQSLAASDSSLLEYVNCLPTEKKSEASVQSSKGKRLERWWSVRSGTWYLSARQFIYYAGGSVRMSLQGYWFRFRALAKLEN